MMKLYRLIARLFAPRILRGASIALANSDTVWVSGTPGDVLHLKGN